MNWETLLSGWEQRVLGYLAAHCEQTGYSLRREALERRSLRSPPAAVRDIEELESRIGAQLPPSYRSFLLSTNGWLQIGMDAEDARILSAAKVDLYLKRNPAEIEAWTQGRRLPDGTLPVVPDSDYLVYGTAQDCTLIRDDYLVSAVAVSEQVDSAVYLLNPCIVHQGEWEAWRFGFSLPGAARYRSFAELMEAEWTRIESEFV